MLIWKRKYFFRLLDCPSEEMDCFWYLKLVATIKIAVS